ncbi:MAG: 1,4-alpha-glucan branching protein [Anaerolineae bacterium]|nr:1,4-alpha-glucan branching protein [Anaerolineae bacterium]
MAQKSISIHFDNLAGFQNSVAYVKVEGSEQPTLIKVSGEDAYGKRFDIPASADNKALAFKFGEANDPAKSEADSMWRVITAAHLGKESEFWCRSWNPFVYKAQPQIVQTQSASELVEHADFVSNLYVSTTGGRFGLGASPLKNGGVLFGFYHPHAAHVFVAGDFNDWQYPGTEKPQPERFLEMKLYRGYFDTPNVWLLKVDQAQVGQRYKFFIQYDALAGDGTLDNRFEADPYARFLEYDYARNACIIVNPSRFEWHDGEYHTPAINDLIIYELHVHGFTHNHPDIQPDHQGKYVGLEDRIKAGYFDRVGATALHLLPLAEVPTPQGEESLGYNTSLFMALERDFGTPDEFRHLVDTAHQANIAIIADQVFNHAANEWNPLWKLVLDHPDEALRGEEGGLYFSGQSPWGNRVATERTEVQNMLIDTCKLMLVEYHIDGFRFDFTHSSTMDHGFLQRLADELQALKPDVILIAENMPNENDLNRQGFNGFAQWCDRFHDTIKAMLREGEFEGVDNHPENLGDIFYFSKGSFAAHTNNVVNFCESHDEHSVPHEVSFVEDLNSPQAKERKARLGLMSAMVALGQPMLYMGQEFGVERARNHVYFDFPANLDEHGFFQWASRLIRLRRRYPGLKLNGYNPIEEGEFTWSLGPRLGERQGNGQRVIGWRATPSNQAFDVLVVLLNLENHAVEVDVDFGKPGTWVRLASIDAVNDIAPEGTNSADDPQALRLDDGIARGFVLPDSSGFIYKLERPVG